MIREFLAGVASLAHGFGTWRRHPGLMLLGLVPAALVFALILVALVTLGFGLPRLSEWATPFADDWDPAWRSVFRLAIAAVTFAAAVLLAVVTFTAITLAVGDPFYERIWQAVERDLGGEAPDRGAGFWQAVGDALELLLKGLLAAVVVWLVGLIPVVGGFVAPVLGVLLGGRILARELANRAFEARGLHLAERRALLRSRPWRVLGFGVATQLCFLLPLGAVITMPAAVAGSTRLARGLLDERAAAASMPGAPVAAVPAAPGPAQATSPSESANTSSNGTPPAVSTVQPEASARTSDDETLSSLG
ncbi:EI24 domain-containing protein [Agromyces sp. MMS24-K17]|uniref:EI24 domain-containing protein n=1 Tax=Agromyces sp. MMS24-K17 TaxID=3372850 RepID=UPI0037550693